MAAAAIEWYSLLQLTNNLCLRQGHSLKMQLQLCPEYALFETRAFITQASLKMQLQLCPEYALFETRAFITQASLKMQLQLCPEYAQEYVLQIFF